MNYYSVTDNIIQLIRNKSTGLIVHIVGCILTVAYTTFIKQESVRPRWPYDMRPSVRAEKYIRDASG